MNGTITPRWPQIAFDKDDIIWDHNPEFSQICNASSTFLPVLEPWLNRVLIRCRKQLGPGHERLKQDIDDFVRQESNHYRMHALYNEVVEAAGYKCPKEWQEEAEAEYRNLLNTKSLEWLAAYSAGFENLALFQARYFFEGEPDLLREGNGIAEVMQWHMAEEFEHRSVCHDVFQQISGKYFLRIFGLIYSTLHLREHSQGRVKLYLEQYRQGMTKAERKASIRRQRAQTIRMMVWTLPRAIKILSPWYDPSKAKLTPKMERALKRYEQMDMTRIAA